MNISAEALAVPPRRDAWQVQRAVLFALMLREMKARASGQWIGAVWTVFEPLLHVAVLLGVHRLLRGPTFGSMEFTVYFVTGLIPYFFFQKLVFRLLDGVDANRGLFNYRQVKPMDALMARAAVEGLLYVVVYSVTLVVLGWGGLEVVPDLPLQVIMVNGLTGVFGASMGLLFAVLGHDRHRLRSTIRLSFLPLYFASGVILRLDLLPQHVVDLLLWNPLIHLVELSRHGFYARYPTPAGVNIYYPFAWTLVSAALGLSLYRVNRLRLLTIN